jgi:protein MpaA
MGPGGKLPDPVADPESPPFEKHYLVGAVAASGLPVLGFSRRGLPIAGGWCPADLATSRPVTSSSGRLLVVGGIHGDEPSSVEAVLELILRLRSSRVLGEGALVVPALNPDGLLVGRKNAASDVDLNRNFPARNFVREHGPGYDPGPSPLSEPETALLARIVADQAIDAVVAVHAPFACVNFDGPAQDWAQAVATACGWPPRQSIGYPTPGSLGSWLGVDRNLPVLTLELPPGPLSGFRAAAAAGLDAAIARSRSAVNVHEIG